MDIDIDDICGCSNVESQNVKPDFSNLYAGICCFCKQTPNDLKFSEIKFEGIPMLMLFCNHVQGTAKGTKVPMKAKVQIPMCHFCGLTRRTQQDMSSHIQTEHQGELLHKSCSYCQKLVKDKSLHQHIFDHFRESGLFHPLGFKNPTVSTKSIDFSKITEQQALNSGQRIFDGYRMYQRQLTSAEKEAKRREEEKELEQQKQRELMIEHQKQEELEKEMERQRLMHIEKQQQIEKEREEQQRKADLARLEQIDAERKSIMERLKKANLDKDDDAVVKQHFQPVALDALKETAHVQNLLYLEPIACSDIFDDGEEDLFVFLKENSFTERKFAKLLSILRNSALIHKPVSEEQRILWLDSWKRVVEITNDLDIPAPRKRVLEHPVYSIKDWLKRISSKKKFWENLISSSDFVVNPGPKKLILDDLMKSVEFVKLVDDAKAKQAKALFINLYIDGFDMFRFSALKSLCGIYIWLGNLAVPLVNKVQDGFLVSLFPNNLDHNLFLRSVFEELNELFNGILLLNPITGEKEKFIVYLYLILADTPERADIICQKACTADKGLKLILFNLFSFGVDFVFFFFLSKGCQHCELDCGEENFLLVTPEGRRSVAKYIGVMNKALYLAQHDTISSIDKLQKETGYRFFDTNKRSADVSKDKEQPLMSYFQSSPILMLQQLKSGLFSFDNIIVAPFVHFFFEITSI